MHTTIKPTIATVLVLLNVVLQVVPAVSQSPATPAGKCNTYDITTVPLDFPRLAKLKWELIYVPDGDVLLDVDYEFRDVAITGINRFTLHNKRVKKNKSVDLYDFNMTYVDGVLIEDIKDFTGTHQYRIYPLAITAEDAVLYYRCSDTGTLDIETRYITIPRRNELSVTGLQQLLDADKKYSWFRGNLRKLEKKLAS